VGELKHFGGLFRFGPQLLDKITINGNFSAIVIFCEDQDQMHNGIG
jgi:hypothetical protein